MVIYVVFNQVTQIKSCPEDDGAMMDPYKDVSHGFGNDDKTR